MKTKLIEFKNNASKTLRGILTYSSQPKNRAVVIMGGFERSPTTERKFKALADVLGEKGISSFRFDHTGVGLSDGDFSRLTLKNLGDELMRAVKAIKQEVEFKRISFVSHSLPSCLVANPKLRKEFSRIVMISPALNQRDLLRYWFVKSAMAKDRPELEINWDNYKNYLDEDKFQVYANKSKRMTRAHHIGSGYLIENINKDYSKDIHDKNNILHIHGGNDQIVPLKSLNMSFKNKLIISGGDHELERPGMLEQWVDKTVEYLLNK